MTTMSSSTNCVGIGGDPSSFSSSRVLSQQPPQDPSYTSAGAQSTTGAASSSNLSNQLAEFHNFGASLSLVAVQGHGHRATSVASGGSGSDEGGASSMTPVPLRTT